MTMERDIAKFVWLINRMVDHNVQRLRWPEKFHDIFDSREAVLVEDFRQIASWVKVMDATQAKAIVLHIRKTVERREKIVCGKPIDPKDQEEQRRDDAKLQEILTPSWMALL